MTGAEPLPDPVAWLAGHLLGAHELLLIHRGELDAARAAISASFRGYGGGEDRFQVRGVRVGYRYAGMTGTVPVARLVEYAAQHHDPAVGEQLARAYADYVRAATRDYTLAPADRRYRDDPAEMHRRADAATAAARDLTRCAEAWWHAQPAGQQLDLFTDT